MAIRVGGSPLGRWIAIGLAFAVLLSGLPLLLDSFVVVKADTLVSGEIPANTTWGISGSPYIIVGNVFVLQNVTLTLEAGIEVRFDGIYSLRVNGTLLSLGTADSRVLITSNSPDPYEGAWWCVCISREANTLIAHTDIMYGKYGLNMASSHNTVTNSTFRRNYAAITLSASSNNTILWNDLLSSEQYGIRTGRSGSGPSSHNQIYGNNFSNNKIAVLLESPENRIERNRFTNNFFGLHASFASNSTVQSNSFLGNSRYAIYSYFEIAAKANYWGTNDISKIDRFVTPNVDTTAPLNTDPTETQLDFVNGTETWSGNVYLDRGLLVNGNLTLDGAEILFNASNGENFLQVNGGLWVLNSTFSSVVAHNVSWGDYTVLFTNRSSGVMTGSSASSQQAITVLRDNMRIENSSFEMGYWGLLLKNCDGVGVWNNIFLNNRYGVDVVLSPGLSVSSNTFEYNDYGLWAMDSRFTVIENNLFSDNIRGIWVVDTENTSIESNSVFRNHIYGIFYARSHWGKLVSNTLMWNGDALQFSSSENNTINDNVIEANNGEGIHGGRSHNNMFSNNTIRGNLGGGFELFENNYWNVIRDNRIEGNSQVGLMLSGSTPDRFARENIIENNSILLNEEGVILERSFENIIRGNDISWNSGNGVHVSLSDGNTVESNIVSLNDANGIYLESSNFNEIGHNTIMCNAVQAYDDRDTNQWDNGYPSGGNYWSDYTGVDFKSGPNQDQPGGDGIGDTPYIIDPDSQDRYPLVTPPVTIPPRPPVVLSASLSGIDLESVTLMWSLSPDDGAGLNSVIGYEIMRGTAYNPTGSGYGVISTLPSGMSTFTDSLAGEGNPSDFFYQVCAVDSNNTTVCAETQAAKFTRPLSQGPNLMSIPLAQSDESIETVLRTVEYDKAWHYDSSSGEWKWFMKHKGYRRGLFNINHTMGIWINVTQGSNLTVAGIVPAQTTIHMHAGWNLVSFPSFNTTCTVADLKAETGATRVEGYDLSPPYFLRVLTDGEAPQAGYGYWVKVDAPVIWVMENG